MELRDQHGLDVLQGVGLNRDDAATEEAAIVYSGTSVHPPIGMHDRLWLHVMNLGASAQATVYVYYRT